MAKTRSLTAFLKPNKVEKEPNRIYVTDSFIDEETGKPILWEIKPVSAEREKLISDSVVTEKRDKATGTITQVRDDAEYLARLSADAVVYPDLLDVGLQKSYGVNKATTLLRKMLSVGELVKLASEVMRVSGLTEDDAELKQLELEADIEASKN